jgi:phage terminase large subunit
VPVVWGLDVARFGNDSSALCKRKGRIVLEPVKSWKGLDLMQTVGRLQFEYDAAPQEEKPGAIYVDSIGLGSGVVDRGRELGLPVIGVNVSESPSMKGQFVNLRAELWCFGRDWLNALDCKLPNDPRLTGELTVPRYKFQGSKLAIESKDDMKKRGLKSPDHAEAFILTFAGGAAVASGAKSWVTSWSKPLKRNVKGVV